MPFSDEDEYRRPWPIRDCGAIGDTERRLRGTIRLSVASDSHSDWLSRLLIGLAVAYVGNPVDDDESALRRVGGLRTGGDGAALVSKEVELSNSGFGADFGSGLDGLVATSPAREAIESLMLFSFAEAVSSPESGDVGEDKRLLLGCGSMLSRGWRK